MVSNRVKMLAAFVIIAAIVTTIILVMVLGGSVTYTKIPNMDAFGGDISCPAGSVTAAEMKAKCDKDKTCVAYTVQGGMGWCDKNALGAQTAWDGQDLYVKN